MIDPENIPNTLSDATVTQWKRLANILRYLRTEDGCPWDKEQTIASLRPHIIEESSELLDAVGRVLDDPSDATHAHLQEELGDVLLVITMMIVIYEDTEQENAFFEIISQLNEKLIRRHPHVFSDAKIENKEQLRKQWHEIKEKQEGKTRTHISEHKSYMHVLERTKEVQKRLIKHHNKHNPPLPTKIHALSSELLSLNENNVTHDKNSYAPPSPELEKKVGDMLYSLLDIARELNISPTAALTRKLVAETTEFSE